MRGWVIWLPFFYLMAEMKTVTCRIKNIQCIVMIGRRRYNGGCGETFQYFVGSARVATRLVLDPRRSYKRFIFYYFHNSHFTITTGKAFRTVSLWNHFCGLRGADQRGPLSACYIIRFVIHFIKRFTRIAAVGSERLR